MDPTTIRSSPAWATSRVSSTERDEDDHDGKLDDERASVCFHTHGATEKRIDESRRREMN